MKATVYGKKPRNVQHLKLKIKMAFNVIPLNTVNVFFQPVVAQCVTCIAFNGN